MALRISFSLKKMVLTIQIIVDFCCQTCVWKYNFSWLFMLKTWLYWYVTRCKWSLWRIMCSPLRKELKWFQNWFWLDDKETLESYAIFFRKYELYYSKVYASIGIGNIWNGLYCPTKWSSFCNLGKCFHSMF